MSVKFRRGVVAAATALALTTGTAVVAPAANAAATSSAAGTTAISIIGSLAGIALSLAFWGTVYNFLVNHGHVNGNIIRQLPVF
ncbi:hypothetical protein QVA66_07030 [Staphylococcus chromogenes]|nr:hypothetical protein [Staphylococcus chromogenes]